MLPLIEGYRRFRESVFPARQEVYTLLAEGQRPRYLFITCSDSRVDPHEFTQTDAGDMFFDRSLGNIIPLAGGAEHEALAVVEYAVKVLQVSHIIICGHSRCGAVKGMLEPETLASMPSVKAWLDNAAESREAIARKYAHLKGNELWDAAVRENVRVQVEHAKRLPVVAPRVAEGRLAVHGWVFEFETVEVVVYDERSDRFVSLPEAYADYF